MRQFVLVVTFIGLTANAVQAQLVVNDPAVTLRNSVTAVLKEYVLNVQREQHSKLRRMAQRLSLHTSLAKYAMSDPPRWRVHGGDVLSLTQLYNEALSFGDRDGTAYLAISHPLTLATLPPQLTASARRDLFARLATVNAADAVAISATHDTGQLRYIGRKHELPAIDALEAHVIDPSNEQSATAVLDKLSGAVLVGARQRQARMQLLAGIVEQLIVDSKRARDTEAAAINMQLMMWRGSQTTNDPFVTGYADALRTWRQP